MVRLSDLPEYEREHLLAKNDPPMGPDVFVVPSKKLQEMRIALLTTAGLHLRDHPQFELADASFRPLPDNIDTSQLVTSHSSANWDRLGLREDINVVFPLDLSLIHI